MIHVCSMEYASNSGALVCLGSQLSGGSLCQHRILIPKLEGSFTGTGDLMTALLLAWINKLEGDLPRAMENAVATMQAVLHRTREWGDQHPNVSAVGSVHSYFN